MNYKTAPKTPWWRLLLACPRRLDRKMHHRRKKFFYARLMRETLAKTPKLKDTGVIMINFHRYTDASLGYHAHGGKVDQRTITERMVKEMRGNG